jgi:3-dehydroquinate dehydratase-2
MRIVIINGANLNLLGTREVEMYGKISFDNYLQMLKTIFPNIEIHYYQSNVEGEIINYLQQEGFVADGIILNPGGYTHTSVAIGDCIAAIKAPVIEVHITNINAREEFRKISYVSAKCIGTISGLGLEGYHLAIQYFVNKR